jgi:nickel superoxide dismutase
MRPLVSPTEGWGNGSILLTALDDFAKGFFQRSFWQTTHPLFNRLVTMLNNAIALLNAWFPATEVHAHCDGPCGVYDPSAARITAEAVLSMTKKILALEEPADAAGKVAYANTLSRYIAIKEEQAQKTKDDLLILWTDYFKPVHLESYPDLHDTFWKAAKLCSACKVEVSQQHAEELMAAVEKIHNIFWATKGRDVAWYTAS